ncbi:MAG: glycosyltransferase family 87 protein [Porphyromonas sp.]|nr:glycosyltransferase family 87 protein [Porphyromonas sp.]
MPISEGNGIFVEILITIGQQMTQKKSIKAFLLQPESIFFFGLLLTLIFSTTELVSLKANNFQIFAYGSKDFWGGTNPYSAWEHTGVAGNNLDRYLYGPLFSILFTPFAFLPWWLGAAVWNLTSYSAFFYSLYSCKIWDNKRLAVVFFLLVGIMVSSIMSFQFNLLITAMFLFIYKFLEEERYTLALLLLVIGALTKVYIAFAGVLLFFYPQFWKNIGRGILLSAVGLLLPAIRVGVDGLLPYYRSWFDAVSIREAPERFEVVYRLIGKIGFPEVYQYTLPILLAATILPTLVVAYCVRKDKGIPRTTLAAMLIGTVMMTLMVWGNSTERHTYIIGMTGYLLWGYAKGYMSRTDKIFTALFFFFYVICPIDVLCPVKIRRIILDHNNLGVIFALILWGRMSLEPLLLCRNRS